MAVKVIQTSFTATPEDIDRLFACNRISAMIWNKVLELAKEYALANNGKWAGKTYLQTATRDIYPLHSQSVQAVVHNYLFARNATGMKFRSNLRTSWLARSAGMQRWVIWYSRRSIWMTPFATGGFLKLWRNADMFMTAEEIEKPWLDQA